MITEAGVTVDTGANASAEEAEEAVEDAETKVNNIVHSFRLQSTNFDKKGYLGYLKGLSHPILYHTFNTPLNGHSQLTPHVKNTGYLKAVKAKLQEKGADADTIAAFEKGAQAYVKDKLLPNFKDLEFYTGESMDPDAM